MKNAKNILAKASAFAAAASAVATMSAGQVLAGGFGTDDVTITGGGNAAQMMGKVIGILLTITRFVGVALVVYGIYEVVMSFMQDNPQQKTKGIVMALSGIVMTALKSILGTLGVIQQQGG